MFILQYARVDDEWQMGTPHATTAANAAGGHKGGWFAASVSTAVDLQEAGSVARC